MEEKIFVSDEIEENISEAVLVEEEEALDSETIAKKIQEVVDSFEEESPAQKDPKGFLKTFMAFIQGNSFTEKVNEKAKKYNVPAKKIAKSFIGKVFGVIGDVLGLGIDVVNCTVQGVVNLLASILNGTMSLIAKVAGRIARIVTFNMTACED